MTAFSQKDTIPLNKYFPTPIVKLIIKDLLSGDSAKSILKLTEQQLDSTIRKTYILDSVIGVYIEKEKNYGNIIGFERVKFNTLQKYTNAIEIDLKNEKTKSKLLRWFNYGLIGVIVVFTIAIK